MTIIHVGMQLVLSGLLETISEMLNINIFNEMVLLRPQLVATTHKLYTISVLNLRIWGWGLDLDNEYVHYTSYS